MIKFSDDFTPFFQLWKTITTTLRKVSKWRKSEVEFIQNIEQNSIFWINSTSLLRHLETFLSDHAREVKKVLQPPHNYYPGQKKKNGHYDYA